MTRPSEQLKSEIENKVKPAIDTVIVERESITSAENAKKTKGSNHIDRDDWKQFLKAISIERIECVGHTRLDSSRLVETNETRNDHQFEGHPSRYGNQQSIEDGMIRSSLIHQEVHGDAMLRFSVSENDHYSEEPHPVPAQTRRASNQCIDVLTHKLHLVVYADCTIRVYSHTPVRQGAAIGGGVGTALGAAGGTAGGVAAGALIGSVVPVAGTIVGGVIGGIIGFFGGAAAGGV